MANVIPGNYDLAALDMDGTLLNSAHEITPYTRAVIARAAAAGKIVALSTGRCLTEVESHLRDNPGIAYVIGENGAYIYDVRAARMLRQLYLPDDAAERILTAASGVDVGIQAFFDNRSHFQMTDDAILAHFHIESFASVFRESTVYVPDMLEVFHRRRQAEKINLYFPDARGRDAFSPLLEGLPVRISGSVGIGFEIAPEGATKAEGLKLLCAHLGLPAGRAMAVGDGGNDLELMGASGLAVAMGNAIDEVRALADAFTDDCDHDGCAKALRRWLLGEDV